MAKYAEATMTINYLITDLDDPIYLKAKQQGLGKIQEIAEDQTIGEDDCNISVQTVIKMSYPRG